MAYQASVIKYESVLELIGLSAEAVRSNLRFYQPEPLLWSDVVCDKFGSVAVCIYAFASWRLGQMVSIVHHIIGGVHLPWVFGMVMLFRIGKGDISPMCYTRDIYPDWYFGIVVKQFVVFVLASFLLYIAIAIKLWKSRNQIGAENHSNSDQLRSQRRLTVTMGISSLFTFLFIVGPVLLIAVLEKAGASDMVIRLATGMRASIGLMNSAINFILYTTRHRDMRLGIKYLFKCKELTEAVVANEQHKQNAMQIASIVPSQQKHTLRPRPAVVSMAF